MQPTVVSLTHIKDYIEKMDFSQIVDKLTRLDTDITNIAKPWSQAKAREAVEQYKHYLWIIKKFAAQYEFIPPTIEIDEIWHAHILDTRRYHDDCLKIFGHYLHHNPYFGLRGSADLKNLHASFKITQELHYREFGDYIYAIEDEVHAA